MTTIRVQDGDSVTYTNAGSAISAGDPVVMGAAGIVTVGIALTDIAATTGVGEVAITGVFDMLATTGAAFTAGESVDYDDSTGLVDDNAMTPAAGDVSDFGIAMETIATAGAGSRVKVKLTPGNGAIT